MHPDDQPGAPGLDPPPATPPADPALPPRSMGDEPPGTGGGRRVRKRWLAAVVIVAAAIALWFWIGRGPGRGGGVHPERFVPLAAELEGIRGVRLYYGVTGADSLAEEYRDVVVKDRPADQVRAVYRELVAGPTGKNVALFPEGTELLNAYLTPRGTLYLDWNRNLVQGFRGGSGRERLLLASIVRTAVENFPEVTKVTLLVDGAPVETIGGHYNVLAPLVVAEWQ